MPIFCGGSVKCDAKPADRNAVGPHGDPRLDARCRQSLSPIFRRRSLRHAVSSSPSTPPAFIGETNSGAGARLICSSCQAKRAPLAERYIRAFRVWHYGKLAGPERIFSRLHGCPAGSPVNASSRSSPCATHDSGRVWFAVPFLLETFTLCFLPISRRNQITKWGIVVRCWKERLPFRVFLRFGRALVPAAATLLISNLSQQPEPLGSKAANSCCHQWLPEREFGL
jgi:hypothetical protein